MERVESENCEQRVRRSSSELSRTEGRRLRSRPQAIFILDAQASAIAVERPVGGVLTCTTITRVVGCIVGLVGGIIITLLRC